MSTIEGPNGPLPSLHETGARIAKALERIADAVEKSNKDAQKVVLELPKVMIEQPRQPVKATITVNHGESGSQKAYRCIAIVGGKKKKFTFFEGFAPLPRVKLLGGKCDDFVVLKGRLASGGEKVKQFMQVDGQWFTMAWGTTQVNPNRHKFDAEEADIAAKLLGNRDVITGEKSKKPTYYIALENDRRDFIRAWLVLYSQLVPSKE